MKTLILLIITANALNAKIIFVDIHRDPENAERIVYTADPQLKVWEFKNMLFKYNAIDPNSYILVKDVPEGFSELHPFKRLSQYGKKPPYDTVRFYVIRKLVEETGERMAIGGEHPFALPTIQPAEKPEEHHLGGHGERKEVPVTAPTKGPEKKEKPAEAKK
ncbi:MAG TPA: hypothetical protein VEL47_01220, partial [Myxococcota bacterium]|nr:hypothetical protein [Myxococcota bacterium]